MRDTFQNILYKTFSEHFGHIPFGIDYNDLETYKRLTTEKQDPAHQLNAKKESIESQRFFSTGNFILREKPSPEISAATQNNARIESKLSAIKNKYIIQFKLLENELANLDNAKEIVLNIPNDATSSINKIEILEKQLEDLKITPAEAPDIETSTFVETLYQKYKNEIPQTEQTPEHFFQFLFANTESFLGNNSTNDILEQEQEYDPARPIPNTGLLAIPTPPILPDNYHQNQLLSRYITILNFYESPVIIDINGSLTKRLSNKDNTTSWRIKKTETGFLVQSKVSPHPKITPIDPVIFQTEENDTLHLLFNDELKRLHAAYMAKKDKVVLIHYDKTTQYMPMYLIFQLLDTYNNNPDVANNIRHLLKKLMSAISFDNDPTEEIKKLFHTTNDLLYKLRQMSICMTTETQFLQTTLQGLLLCAVECDYTNIEINTLYQNMELLAPLSPNKNINSQVFPTLTRTVINSFATPPVDNLISNSSNDNAPHANNSTVGSRKWERLCGSSSNESSTGTSRQVSPNPGV